MSTRSTRAMVPMLMFSVAVLVAAVLVAMIQPGDIGGTKTATTPAAHEVAAPTTTPAASPSAPAPNAATPATAPGSGGLAGSEPTTPTTAPATVLGNDIERTPSVEDASRLAHTGGTTSFLLPLAALGLAAALYVLLRRTRPPLPDGATA